MLAALMNAFSRNRSELEELEIRQWHTTHAVIVRVFGEVWSSNIETFQDSLLSLTEHPQRITVVDLTGVSFMGSQGMSALLNLSQQLRAAGMKMSVVAPALSPVREALEVTKLDRVLRIDETVASALIAQYV